MSHICTVFCVFHELAPLTTDPFVQAVWSLSNTYSADWGPGLCSLTGITGPRQQVCTPLPDLAACDQHL